MEAESVPQLPRGTGWQYEPKWDGFRCLVFRDGARVVLQSKSGRPLGRYFPELVQAILALKPERFVLDGEIVIVSRGRHDFDQLLQRIHPAASRIKTLAATTPARLMVFDLLEDATGNIASLPLAGRRPLLERFARKYFPRRGSLRLSPATKNLPRANRWLNQKGSFLDGIIAKRLDFSYASGERTAMQKFKRIRTADCVVGGFRYAEGSPVLGSLLLGLYEDKLLHHVGFTSSFSQEERRAMVKTVQPLIAPPGFTGRAPGGPSRWSTKRSSEWKPLLPQLVVEVAYDHVTNDRFRHGTKFVRWRPDKAARQCTMEQIKPASPARSTHHLSKL